VKICGVHGGDYKCDKFIVWCYSPRGGDFATRVCNMIRMLQDKANALKHVTLCSL